MKKLMIAAAIVCATAFANAATVGWSCAGLGDFSGDAYSIFVIGQNNVSSIAQITGLIEASTDISDYAFGSGLVAENGGASTSAANSGKTLAGGSTYEAFYVIFNTPSQLGSVDPEIAKATKYLVISKDQAGNLVKSPASTASTFSFSAGNQGDYAGASTNWKNVPEPTSGLLLLLGVGALALRRRRA